VKRSKLFSLKWVIVIVRVNFHKKPSRTPGTAHIFQTRSQFEKIK
jgi:hypothetical protein